MGRLRGIGLWLPFVACATVGHARLAEQMGCPEDEIEPVPQGLGAEASTTEAPPGAVSTLYRGCDQTWECTQEQCEETAGSKTSRLARAVPALMERSVQELAPKGTADRTGPVGWRLSSPSRGSTDCVATSETAYHCDRGWIGRPPAAP
jgi:hypothetical protein